VSARRPSRALLSDSLLSAFLRLYPADFRASFGDEMLDVFAARCEEVRRRRGVSGVLLLWARTLPGLLRAAALERMESRSPSPRLPRKGSNPMDRLLQDLRYGARTLLRSPGFTAVAVLTLGLGIGVNTSVFSLVNALLLRPLPQVQEPSRLVVMFTGDYGYVGVSSYMDYLDFTERSRTLSGFAAYKPRGVDFTGDQETQRIEGMMVSANYFDVLGVQPRLGRFFVAADDDEPGAETVAVLSHELWQSAYGGDPDVVGGTVRLNGLAFDIIGVAPEGFRGTSLDSRPQVFVPMMMQPHLMPSSGNLLDQRGWGGIQTVGRLADGVSLQQARDDFAATADWLRETYPRTAGERGYGLHPLAEATLFPEHRQMAVGLSTVLAALMGLVLLVACVNVANLMLSRALRRRREIAVRQALGAGRGRLVRQLLIESLTLAALGGLVGLALALAGRGVLEGLPLPFVLDFGVDSRILAFTALITLLTGVGFGVFPAVAATRVDLSGPMRSAQPGGRDRRFSLGAGLVVAQVALSLVLLVAAGLFVRTFVALASSDPGFDPENVVVAAVDPSLQGYEVGAVRDYYARLTDRVGAIPGIRTVSLAGALPAGGDDMLSYHVENAETGDDAIYTDILVVSPGYFETLAIPLTRGRAFRVTDDADAPRVLIVNEAAARSIAELVPGDPMDARISFSGPDGPWMRIVGVAADSKNRSLREDPRPLMYGAAAQGMDMWPGLVLLARTDGVRAESVIPSLREALREVDPNVPAFQTGTLDQQLAGSLSTERLLAGLIGFAALLALLLASIGLYGVLAYSVSRRTREMGIRLALGARTGSVRAMIVRRALLLVGIGTVLGVAASMAAASALAGFLYGVSPTDPITYGAVVATLVAVALAASYVPARRATRVDPLVALRAE